MFPAMEYFGCVLWAVGLLVDGVRPGLDASLFFVFRCNNFKGANNFAGVVVLDVEHTFGYDDTTVVSLGLRVDGLALIVPFLLLWGALQ
jgi:hypothetical protein